MTDAEKMGGKFTDYLLSGGLFNPELMDTKAVSELIVECRDVLRAQAAEIERLTKERDEAKAYLRAFLWATKNDEGLSAVGVHEVNPTMAWHFMLLDEDAIPSYQITGGQIRRAMEIVGFDNLKEKPARQTIAKELAQAMKHKAERDAALTRIGELEEAKDGAYLERNRLVALLASIYPSARWKTAIDGWSEDWHGCVYITLPTGQASWHYHDSHAHLFSHVPEAPTDWDGHTTSEKYERVYRAHREDIS
jgi:hypothetical protein